VANSHSSLMMSKHVVALEISSRIVLFRMKLCLHLAGRGCLAGCVLSRSSTLTSGVNVRKQIEILDLICPRVSLRTLEWVKCRSSLYSAAATPWVFLFVIFLVLF